LVAMAASLSTYGLPSNTIPCAHPIPQPKRHLDRFSRFAQLTTVSLYFTMGLPSPSKLVNYPFP